MRVWKRNKKTARGSTQRTNNSPITSTSELLEATQCHCACSPVLGLRATTAQQRITGQNLPSGLYIWASSTYILQPRNRRQFVPPKRQHLPTRLQGVTTHITTVVRTSELRCKGQIINLISISSVLILFSDFASCCAQYNNTQWRYHLSQQTMGVLFIILFYATLHVSAYNQAIFRCLLTNHNLLCFLWFVSKHLKMACL
jgi:hypothetical protein